jgi:hypothetical protein
MQLNGIEMRIVNRFLFIFIVLIIGQSSALAQDEYAIYDDLQGKWQVKQWHEGDGIGTLIIRDSSYTFLPKPGVTVYEWMRKRFSFIDQVKGTFTIESYRDNLKPEDRVEDLEDHDILLTCKFNNQSESFFIRYDQEKNEFYFHALISEFQGYQIIRRL